MVVDVVTEITINRPLSAVAEYAGDPSNAPAWYVNIKSVDWQTPVAVQVGSKIAFAARFLGRTLSYTYEIVDFIPAERLVMRTAQGPFPMETTYTWRALGEDATTMAVRNRGEPSGFSTLFAPFMAPAVRRANRKDLSRLKSIMEAA